MKVSYVPLWCKSNSSFLEGASHPEELIEQAAHWKLPAIALTDRNGVYGLPKAYEKCRELGSAVRLICGVQVELWDKVVSGSDGFIGEGARENIVLLAESFQGWKSLCGLLTLGARRGGKAENLLGLEDLASFSSGLLALWGGGEHSLLKAGTADWRARGGFLKELFSDRLYSCLSRHRLLTEKKSEPVLRQRSRYLGTPLVAVREVLYHLPHRRQLQDVMTCIRHGRTLSAAGTLLRLNSDFGLLCPDEFHDLYSDQPEALQRTVEVSERCHFSLNQLTYRYPDEPLPEGITSSQRIRELALLGARERYDETKFQQAKAQIEKELEVIFDLDYVGYFLTMFEIVSYCRGQEILCQGRGSAANSVVCYCLGITAVDPLKHGLLFERFLSKERAEPPDIDLDIAHQRREEVIAWMYERYGRERAAMVCNVVRYRPRSAVREVGKVLQIEVPVIERLARLLTGFSTVLEEPVLEAADLPKDAHVYRLLLRLVNEIVDFPRHLSIHPGGFLLGRDPVSELVPIENATMEGRTVIQWDKYDVESLGLFKVDLLGLGALTHLDRAFQMIKETKGVELCMATLPKDDAATYEMLGRADSVGVFQVESRAQMAMLPVLKPERYYDLVIQVAIVRPGPITGGMVHPYLRRRSKLEEIEYPHELLKPVLEKTLGVPLFQEQVMKIAVIAADYTPGEADQLRRDMAAWKSHGKLEGHREKLLSRMKAKGIEERFAERVFEQIKGFGEYGFPESHAASFALITYATSYVRCHYLPEFTCALLNSLPMGFYSASTLLEDAKRKGMEILPFCVEMSQWENTLEKRSSDDFALRLGLKMLKGLSETAGQKIVARRPYQGARELTIKAELNRKELEVLASSGALDVYGKGRRSQLWSVDDHLQAKAMPLLREHLMEGREFSSLHEDEEVVWDFEVAGLSSRGHPMRALRKELGLEGFQTAQKLQSLANGSWAKVAAMVICRQRPPTANGTLFMTLEDETGFVNVILWSSVFQEYSVLARSEGLIAVEGQIQSGRGSVHLVARKLYRPGLEPLASVGSRDFH